MRPTRLRLLFGIAVITGVLGWVVATVADSIFSRYLPVPWSAAIAIWMLAAALGIWIWLVRPRLLRREGTVPLSPFVAARTAALALAASRVGAGVAGAYVGIGVVFLSALQIQAGREGAIVSGVSALGGLAMVGLGLWLEHLCRIREDEDDDKTGSGKIDLRRIAGTTERSSAA